MNPVVIRALVRRRASLLLFVMSCYSSFGAAADLVDDQAKNWHQWRGPLATGVAPAGDPPVTWSETQNVRWKSEIPGNGKSTPIIWGDRVFLLTAVNTSRVAADAVSPDKQPMRPFGIKFPNTYYRFVVLCLDRATGKVVWEQTATEDLPHEGHHGDNSFASASPVTDGRFLYVSFGSRGFYCYDLAGKLQWKRALDQVTTRLSFGEASSPVLHGDSVVLNRDNDGKSHLLVLDARTGEPRWQVARDEMSAWATPLIVEHQGVTQVITSASNRVRSYDLATGKVLWECGGQVGNVTPSPVRWGDTVICMSGYRGYAALALPLDARGDITDSDKIIWRYTRDTPYVPSPLLYGDSLYFNKSNSGILTCLDAKTGKAVIEAQRLDDLSNIYASPVGAADRLYFVARDGTATVLRHGSKLEVLATNKIDEPIDASPAIVGQQMFLRGTRHLYCLEAK